MERKPVNSSAVKSIGYDEVNKVVEVEILETGRIYRYFDVPLKEYLLFSEAKSDPACNNSIGTYYNKVFKLKFPKYKEVIYH